MTTETKPKKTLEDLTYEQLVKVRNNLGEKITEADAVTSALKKKRELIDVELMRRFNAEKIRSANTRYGTPHIIERTSVGVADWEAFFAWVQQRDNFDFIERRPSKSLVEAYMKEEVVDDDGNPVFDEKGKPKLKGLPPGLNWSAKNTIGVRKS